MGDIRNTIRETLSKRLREDRSKWDSTSQPNIYELDNFLRKSGYKLLDIIEHQSSDREVLPELLIEPIKSSYLYPEIYHDTEDNLFYAKVNEHGLLVLSDLEEIIKGYTTAVGVLNYLDNLDLKKLEIHPVDEE